MANGILNLLKPTGLTSHDAVQEVRRIFGERRVGHAGTLDPGAAGVLVVCVGEATKAVAFMEGHDKEYWGEAVFGKRTFTQDAEGETLEEAPNGWESDPESVIGEMRQFQGAIDQVVPLVSAVHVEGQRLYDLARRGASVERPIRKVRIDDFSLRELLPNGAGRYGAGARLRFSVTCSAGTYVRALVDDLGQRLGGGAYLAFLLRTRSGPFPLSEALTLEEVGESGEPAASLRPAEAGIAYPEHVLDPVDAARFCNGVALQARGGPAGLRKVYGRRGTGSGSAEFLGVGEVDETGRLRPRRLFATEGEKAGR